MAGNMEGKFKKHKDWVSGKWNVYRIINGRENYISTFDDAQTAQDFCDINNGAPVPA